MSQLKCPYCGSIQIKAMPNQPKKYPRPTDPVELVNWQRGYDCKKCGNDFIVTPPKPKKPIGLFTKLMSWLLLAVITFFVYMAIVNPAKNNQTETATNEPDSIEQVIGEIGAKNSDLKYNEGDPTPIAIEPESIENSANQNDTLSIKTTLRENNE